jgi:hypothetical protein
MTRNMCIRPIISEKVETKNKEKQLGPNENADESLKLAEAYLDLGQNRQLNIKCDQGKTGQKTIEISMPIVRNWKTVEYNSLTIKFQPKEPTTIHLYLPKIRMPQESYKFLEAVDGLIGQLPVDAPPIPG